MEEILCELQAPGGAFLPVPVPTRAMQPTASQRAWLTWQLAHTGATLHWALAALDTMLAVQPLPAAAQSYAAAPQPWTAASQSFPAAPQSYMPWAPSP